MDRAALISRRLKLRHLNVLIEVAEQGSMAKAAERLATSQPFVSKAIADLERLFGRRLLERSARGVEPTVFGRALLARGTAMLDDLRTSISELELLADPSAGRLRIGSTAAMSTTLLPMIVDDMVRRYPRMMFEIVLGDPLEVEERDLRGRRVDLIFGMRLDPVLHDDDLDVTVIYRDRLRIVAGRNNPLSRRRKIALADLVNERWCLPPPDHPVASLVADAFRRSGLQPPQSFITASSAPFTCSLLAHGQFLGVLGSVFHRADVLARASLKALPVELPAGAWPISAATLKTRTPHPLIRIFLGHAREIAKSLATGKASE